jgi:hypothetical protein
MQRCNARCTKETTGAYVVCEALAERDRFFRFWFQGECALMGCTPCNSPWGDTHVWASRKRRVSYPSCASMRDKTGCTEPRR